VIGSLTRFFVTDVTLPRKLSVGRCGKGLNGLQQEDSDINVLLVERNTLPAEKQLYIKILWLLPNAKKTPLF